MLLIVNNSPEYVRFTLVVLQNSENSCKVNAVPSCIRLPPLSSQNLINPPKAPEDCYALLMGGFLLSLAPQRNQQARGFNCKRKLPWRQSFERQAENHGKWKPITSCLGSNFVLTSCPEMCVFSKSQQLLVLTVHCKVLGDLNFFLVNVYFPFFWHESLKKQINKTGKKYL